MVISTKKFKVQQTRESPIAKIATGELNDKDRGGAECPPYTVRYTYYAVVTLLRERSLREFQVGRSVFRAVVRLNVSRIAPRTFRVDAHTTFINERIFRLSFLTVRFSLSLFLSVCLSFSLCASSKFFQPLRATPHPRSLGFRSKRLSSSRGKYRGTLSGRVFPAYYLSDPTSISGPTAFPCPRNNAFPERATRRREGRRLPRDRVARRGFQGNFPTFVHSGEPALEANSSAIFSARLNVTTAPEKWNVHVDTRLFLSRSFSSSRQRRKRR